MRVPISWLRDYVDADLPAAELARLLNFSGTKVAALHQPGGDIDGVVAAEVLSIDPHPNAAKLTLVEVDPGSGQAQRVVCGARNFAVGDLVPFAEVGARLPDMVIEERKIRGEVSRGMLCSSRELGLGSDHSGILVLPPDATPGEAVAQVLGLGDAIVELELTPNRPDCTGMVGIAREVAALTGAKMKPPPIDHEAAGRDGRVEVQLPDPQGCPRYVATYIDGVAVAASPAWLAARLLAAGQRPISNVVDVTNYVMLELGHPLHPFDASRVGDHTIMVRRATGGESMTTLDGVTRTLEAADLVVADPDRALALAGVMGGADSEVSDGTSAVILEAAYFDPASIATTSRRHQLRTEASARFERGMDPEIVEDAAARAAQLIREVAGGVVAPSVDLYPAPMVRPQITLRPERTDTLLGVHVDAERQVELLRSVGFAVTKTRAALDVQVPSWRPDATREVDLIEEVARLEGLDKLASTLPPGRLGGLDAQQAAERTIRRTLAGLGLHEAWTTSFMSARDLDALGLDESDPLRDAVAVANPMSDEERLLRTSLLPGLLRAARHNVARGAGGIALFEVARVYRPSGQVLPEEPTHLAGLFAGNRSDQSWRTAALRWDFFAMKGILETLFDSLHLDPPDSAPAGRMPFHPTRTASLSWGGTSLGTLGELHFEVATSFDLPPSSVAFEIDLKAVLAALPGRPQVGVLPRFPATLIDVAVVVDEAQPAGAVGRAIAATGAPELASLRLFDVYRGPQIPAGKKSLAYALELRVSERTMTEGEALSIRDRIVADLSDRFGARLRA